jgi:hypothetical protein
MTPLWEGAPSSPWHHATGAKETNQIDPLPVEVRLQTDPVLFRLADEKLDNN